MQPLGECNQIGLILVGARIPPVNCHLIKVEASHDLNMIDESLSYRIFPARIVDRPLVLEVVDLARLRTDLPASKTQTRFLELPFGYDYSVGRDESQPVYLVSQFSRNLRKFAALAAVAACADGAVLGAAFFDWR